MVSGEHNGALYAQLMQRRKRLLCILFRHIRQQDRAAELPVIGDADRSGGLGCGGGAWDSEFAQIALLSDDQLFSVKRCSDAVTGKLLHIGKAVSVDLTGKGLANGTSQRVIGVRFAIGGEL